MDESFVTKYPDLERAHFWWATRRNLIQDLVSQIGDPGAMHILDVGCGSGTTAHALAEMGASVTGVDLEMHDTESAMDNVSLVRGDYLEVSPSLGKFDVVMALDVIEHFPDEAKVAAALASNLRPGGRLLVTVPAYRFLWSSHDEVNHHYRRYTASRLRNVLEWAGLRVERVGYLFMILVIPKILLTLVEKLSRRQGLAGTTVASWPNRVAALYFGFETRIASRLSGFLPFGTSVIAVARRPDSTLQSGGDDQV